ncbi:hypothetical protein niasHS_003384 [Heterodera schachtii]|uniref:Trichohyalin n=1 Tax=Heterodera schachtii TaxID=97005 RepID=A0ABD2KGB9_HETSC
MASNESPTEEDNANAVVASSRLFDALKKGEGIAHSLAEAIENGDTEQLQHWYDLIAEVPFEELQQRLGNYELVELLRTVHLLMQWEHAQGEELKEVIDREVTESAEREESWKTEREELKSELTKAKSRSEMGEVNEALREEIEALTAENAQMKQMGRERDGEMAKMGERTEQLEERLRGAERENALLISNQAQLEDSIRELNRRLNTQSEAKQQGTEWEARKLRQRNEQAMVLSEQVRELAAQNDELREEIDRLSGALDEANGLLKENTARFAEFNEQFEEAEKQLERLRTDNGELRKIMEEKEKALKERTLNVQMSSREFVEVVQEKDALLEKQRVQLQQTKAELEQCRLSLETAIRPNEQREEELDRLRVELINATEAARKLFGVEALAGEEQMDDGDAARAEGTARDLRLRMIQMDQQLEQQERSLAQKRQTEHETEQALEQKDLQIARLLTECQRYRKMAFGDAEGQMARIEKQLEYRNKQIEQLNRRCSELQIELEQYIGEEEQAEKQRKEKKGETEEGEQKVKRKRVTIREEEGKEEKAEESMDEEETEEEKEEEEEEEEEYREEIMEEWEEEEKREEKEQREEMEKKRETERAEAKEGRKRQTEKQTVVKSRKSREQLLREATDVQALHGEITRLIRDLRKTEEELNLLRKQYNERGTLLKEEREAKAKSRRETDRLRELLLFNGGDEEAKDPLDKLEEFEGGNVGEITDQTKAEEITDQAEEGKAEQRGQVDPFTELRERERMESLELENAELRRFVEDVAENGRDERERRMAEGTRRLVFLAVKEAKSERRLQISKRLRMAMSTEMRTMKDRLSRVMSGEESKSRQLFVENEAKLFELARLQNALLHSVPVHEYNRLLRQHKRLLRDRFLSSPSDMGYHSETEQPTEDDDFVDKMYTEQHLNIGRTVGDSAHWHNEWSQLREMNDVLRGQNDALNREREKLKAELDELNAFLDDIEAETELKSMLANIERRFLQALREQFEWAEEREALGCELRRSERNFSEARDRWLSERRRLVDTIGHLNSALQRLHRDQLLAIPGSVHVTTSQLEALATHLRRAYQKEREASGRENELEERAEEMQRAESALMAKRAALETILDRDGELRAVHAVLQGYALNEVTLSAELQRTRKKLEKVDKEMNERTEELEELREMLTHFQHVKEVDLKQLEQQIEQRQKRGEERMNKKEEKQSEGKEKQREEKEKQREEKEKQREEKETKGDREEEEQAQKRGDSSRRTVLMVDNSSEWAEQLQKVREQAKLCVDTYKEQLESRDKTLDEYRQLVEQLRTELTEVRNGRREAEEQRKRDGAETEEETSKSGERKRTDEWEAEEAEERWERRTRALERQLRRMAEEQAEMERERTKLRETIRAKEESERRHREGEGTRDVKVQVSISQPKAGRGKKANTKREETTAGGEDEREEEGQEDGEREGDEADKEDQADLEEQEEADSSASDVGSGGGGGRGGSDSGTVEDIQQNEREGTRESDSVGREARKSKASTRTISQRRSFGMEAAQDMETMVMRHRNETRRLRMRVMELERRNRELSEQYASLRERSRLAMRPRSTPSAAAGGTEAAADALRRENERLKRENSNLNKSLEKQREEAERTAIRLRRMETQSRANAEAWEERKRNERSAALLRKRIEEGAERERLLQERLERRERHIEQLSREQQGRLADTERVQATMAQWRAKVALLEQREGTLSQERVMLGERCNELTRRLEAMAREHRNAKKRLAELTKAQQEEKAEEKLREEEKAIGGEGNQKTMARKTEDRREAQTQTEEPNKEQEKKPMPNEAGGTERKNEGRIRSAPPSAGKAAPTAEWEGKWREAEMREMAQQWEEERAEKQRLTKKLRRAELLQRETEEQLETQRKAKERLETEHNALLRLEKRRTLREETESLGMALIRDKLAAKEREVSAQRHRIIELERKLWHMEMAMESEQ